nr:retrovirus-related Pol polyprotein from transposon TNT 1-94 [Tanacetum cinerariifolium]
CRSPKDSRRSGAIEPHRRTAPVKNSTSNALVSQCDGIGSYDWSYQSEEEPANFALMAITSSSSSSDNEVPSCLKACLESVEARLVVYKQNESILEENIKLLNVKVQARDTALVTLRQKLNQAEQERDDLKLKLDKFQTSSKNLTELLASQTNDKHGLGYFSLESDSESLSPSFPSDRLQPTGGYHPVPPPITGTFMPPKPNLVFHTAPIAVETDHFAFTDESETNDKNDPQSVPSFVQSSEQVNTHRHPVQPVEAPIPDATLKPTSPKSKSSSKRRNRKTCFVCRSVEHLIKDCDFHAKKKAQPKPRNYAHRVCAAVTKIMATQPRHAYSIDIKSKSPIRRHITCSPSPKTFNSPPRVTASQAPVFSAAKGPLNKMALLRGKTGPLLRLLELCWQIHFYPFHFGLKITACYVQNRVLVTKPHNKTPYELLHGRTPNIGFMRPFCCPVTILNTLDPLGKFERNVDEGFLVGYSINSKAFRVFNSRTCIVQETVHANFLKNKPNIAGSGPTWLFDIDSLTKTMNYQPVTAGNQSNPSAGFQDEFDAEKAGEEVNQQYVLFPM